jgi:glycosyltransferase involved in cell wall biosynthesis
MPSLYRAADILLSVPWSDLLSLCVLEGIACGCFPVLAGCPDVEAALVGEQGLRAEIVPPRAPEAIAAALDRAVAALEEPVWRERHAALIREHHDARRQEDELGRFYERLAKGKG